MSYIEPNTTIKILRDVPLDNTYVHTIYFSGKVPQSTYFDTKVKYTLGRQSYQRKERGYMRVNIKADDLYDCNYLMFYNTNFGSKIFYAFITSVEYISNDVSEIGYELDVIQTWLFDVTLLDSYIDREHSATDEVGDNIVAEPINVGDMFNSDRTTSGYFDSYCTILVSPYKRVPTILGGHGWLSPISADVTVLPNKVDGQIQGYFYTVLKTETDVATAIVELTNDQGKIEDVLCLYPVPSKFVEDYESFECLNGNTKTFDITYASKKPTALGTYLPKNKKLLTYPYNKLVIENGTGGMNEFPYEFFGGDTIKFKLVGSLLQNLSFKIFPYNYRGVALNYSYPTLLNDFPLTGFSYDSFKAWLAQNKSSVAFQTIASIGVASATMASGAELADLGLWQMGRQNYDTFKLGSANYEKGKNLERKGAIGGALGVGAVMTNLITRSQAPMEIKGTSDGCLEIGIHTKDFTAVQYYVNPTDAKVIDDFFSTYGYATKKIKVPNRNVRQHWTYTKTIGCNVSGNAPAEDVAQICSIYDKGITWWRYGIEVGKYLDEYGNMKTNAPL